ncbi:hypothetical protein PWT90_05585 [Aphanocladium album]|nr:hypothetical protein PWT90_05585 [Aphanocladium album]
MKFTSFSVAVSLALPLSVSAAPTCENPFMIDPLMLPVLPPDHAARSLDERDFEFCGQCVNGKTCCNICSGPPVSRCFIWCLRPC